MGASVSGPAPEPASRPSVGPSHAEGCGADNADNNVPLVTSSSKMNGCRHTEGNGHLYRTKSNGAARAGVDLGDNHSTTMDDVEHRPQPTPSYPQSPLDHHRQSIAAPMGPAPAPSLGPAPASDPLPTIAKSSSEAPTQDFWTRPPHRRSVSLSDPPSPSLSRRASLLGRSKALHWKLPSLPQPRDISQASDSERLLLGRPNLNSPTSTVNEDRRLVSLEPSTLSSSDDFENNPISLENDRHFPPLLPTARPFFSQRERVNAVKHIRSWIRHKEHEDEAELSSSSHSSARTSPSQSATSSSVDSIHNGVDELWRQIRKGRRIVTELRDKLSVQRSLLQSVRLRLSSADNTFMNSIRPLLVHNENKSAVSSRQLHNSFAEMQRLRTECQDLENSCRQVEDDLEEEEFELQRVEVRFYSTLGSDDDEAQKGLHPEAHDSTNIANNVPVELRGIPSHRPLEDLDPAFIRLQLSVDSLRNSREELDSLQRIKVQCDETFWFKKRMMQKVTAEIQDFLDDFPLREASKKKEIAEFEREVGYLKRLCEKNGLMSKHMSTEMRAELYPDAALQDIRLASESSILANQANMAHPILHELMSQPDHLLAAPMPVTADEALREAKSIPKNHPWRAQRIQRTQKEVDINNLITQDRYEGGRSKFVDRWLLSSLRNSSIEITRLYNTFAVFMSIRNLLQWQRDVLQYWDADRTPDGTKHGSDQELQYPLTRGTTPRSRAVSEGRLSLQKFKSHGILSCNGAASLATA